MPKPAWEFVLPSHILPDQQVNYCKEILKKQHEELSLLRKYKRDCEYNHTELEQKIIQWEKQYNTLHEELRKTQKENNKLKKEIEKLTKTNNRYQVGLFDHGNFKHPDLKDKKPNGGQKGHADTNKDKQRNLASFKRQRLFAVICGHCGKPLTRVKAVTDKTLIDIQINTKLIEIILQSERQWCKTCQKEVTVKFTQSLPFTEYGINTFMMILLLKFKSQDSIQNISIVLSLGFGLSISPSGILSLLRQAKIYLKDRYEKLKQAIREGEVMYNDETGWMVHGQKAWMWIMATADKKHEDESVEAGITVYTAAESRGKGIFEEMYGNSKATSMHDGYSLYEGVTGEDNTAYCWSHILRFCYEETVTEKNPTSIACKIRDRLVTLYQTIRNNPQWSKEQKEATLTKELDSIIALPTHDDTSKNIQQRVKTQKEGLIKALLVTPDGTNNLAERELRPMAINRTISFGSATFKGMETTAVLGSVVQTISRNKKQPFLPTLKNYLLTGIQEKYPQYKHPPSFAT